MTAEIAILNKLAVALATDSAVTISAGDQDEKIFDSADKLFELSYHNPLGVMIYNGMQFMQAPLPMLISEYRAQCRSFDTVREAANDFLLYLNNWGARSPDAVLQNAASAMIVPILERIKKRIQKKTEELFASEPGDNFDEVLLRLKAIPGEVIAVFAEIFNRANASEFVGGVPPNITPAREAIVRDGYWGADDGETINRLSTLAKDILLKDVSSPVFTGIVVAGFGTTEKFPSLIAFTIEGVVFDKLKFAERNFVDIDRNGERAKVIPFAQKEMVERFLYGLDTEIERQITVWCEQAVPEIRKQIVELLDMPDEDKESLTLEAQNAEDAFINDLKNKRFEEIRTSSRSAIEGMVEFMPKPELAKMAEALVNLTSIKRRVSRGMETVGGPIDVAVISRSEGFIWVKRKHYFSPDLNPRYNSRVYAKQVAREENIDDAK